MTEATTAARVTRLLVDHLGVDEAKVTPAALLYEDLGADSLDIHEISFAVEDEFGLDLDDAVEKAIRTRADITVAEVVALVEARGADRTPVEPGASNAPARPGAPPLAAGAAGNPGAAAHVLRQARALIAEKGWTQRAYARDANGNDCDFRHSAAVCFCSLGALDRAGCGDGDAVSDAEALLNRALGISSIPAWNDEPGRTRTEILAVFDKAIALAETEAKP